jgi:hypothetical protein
MAVPTGSYSIRLVCGDAAYTDQVNRIMVEDQLTVNGSGGANWDEATATASVNDGKLSVAPAADADNSKLCFIEISSTGLSSGFVHRMKASGNGTPPLTVGMNAGWISVEVPRDGNTAVSLYRIDGKLICRQTGTRHRTYTLPLLRSGTGILLLRVESTCRQNETVRIVPPAE